MLIRMCMQCHGLLKKDNSAGEAVASKRWIEERKAMGDVFTHGICNVCLAEMEEKTGLVFTTKRK